MVYTFSCWSLVQWKGIISSNALWNQRFYENCGMLWLYTPHVCGYFNVRADSKGNESHRIWLKVKALCKYVLLLVEI